MKKIIVIGIVVLLSTPLFGKMRIAVLDFKGDGISIAKARKISDLIRTEIVDTNQYIVIERNQVNAILKEQGFQQTGCTDSSCAVKIGKLLSAKYILIGTIMKLDGRIIINGRIVDVEKGVALFGAKQASSYYTNNLFYTISNFVRKLTNKIRKRNSIASNKDQKNKQSLKNNKYHSPFVAGLVSVFPVWSGSFNNGFDWWGLVFTLGKATCVAVWGGYYHFGTETATTVYGRDVSGLSFFEISKIRTSRAVGMIITMSFWGVLTLADIIYSAIIIDVDNKRIKRKKAQRYAFNITTRLTSKMFNGVIYDSPDNGLNLMVSYKF